MMRKIATRQINKTVETKRGLYTSTDGTEISHNNFITVNSALLATTQGVEDEMNTMGKRIGDEINLTGVSIKLMLELNERYSDVTFRVLVVKCAKGDAPTRANLFTGTSGNKMLDTINKERYTVLAQEYVQMKTPGYGTQGGVVGGGPGLNHASEPNPSLSRATRIVRMYIPGTKFSKTGRIKYENDSSQVKFFDYHLLVYAYSNYSTLQDIWNVGRLNDCIVQLYYKDA